MWVALFDWLNDPLSKLKTIVLISTSIISLVFYLHYDITDELVKINNRVEALEEDRAKFVKDYVHRSLEPLKRDLINIEKYQKDIRDESRATRKLLEQYILSERNLYNKSKSE